MKRLFAGLFLMLVAAPCVVSFQAPRARTYKAPRTPWGDPDLQGVWPSNMGVPMQRPVEFGERAELTEAEFARRVSQADAQAQADYQAAKEEILRELPLEVEP